MLSAARPSGERGSASVSTISKWFKPWPMIDGAPSFFANASRLTVELGRFLLRPADGHRAADLLDVPDRRILVLQALIDAHVVVTRAQAHRQEVVDARDQHCSLYVRDSWVTATPPRWPPEEWPKSTSSFERLSCTHWMPRQHLRRHFRQRDGRQIREVERHVGGASGDDRLGRKCLLPTRLAPPGAAVHEDEGLPAAAVDIEGLGLCRPIALDTGLPHFFPDFITFFTVPPDDFVRVRHPDALLVLVVERLLVVVEEDLGQDTPKNRDRPRFPVPHPPRQAGKNVVCP